ncbi:MAG: 3-dehydroquinate synthase [Cellvibrionaceae bacterium]|nr:3-dehydroquinate synthase [Cellvibrionaceae bacterium]
MTVKKLIVDLDDQRHYPIFIGTHILSESRYWAPYIPGKQVCIVTNETVAPLYLKTLLEPLSAHYQVDTLVLPDGEHHKTTATVMKIYDHLLANKHDRTTTLIALGGGVIGDMTGFAAATYQRGVHFVQVPTTLLAQVDSSVGGKTGVNHSQGKNMIGAFYQPRVVVIDTAVLQSLPPREVSAGMAEVIKYGLIVDQPFYHWLEANMAQLLALVPHFLTEAIARSCQAKADIVSQDEKESGIRAILNLGHTFGHAIEAEQGYGNWLHGEAVAAGMLVAAELSARLHWIDNSEVERLKRVLVSAKLPTQLPENMSPDTFLTRMMLDKKVVDNKLRLVLLKAIGRAVVHDDIAVEQIKASIRGC